MSRKNQKLVVYLIVALIPFLFLFLPSQKFAPLKFTLSKLVSLPVKIISFPIREVKKIIFYHRTFDEYIKLRQQTDTLKSRLIGLEELVRENTRLQKLLDFKRTMVYSSVTASVVGRDPTNWNASIIIDKGSRDGVTAGMPVVNSSGVIGKIAEAGEDQSRVILITDPQFSVAALVQRPRESGLLSGTLQNNCRLQYLPDEADIQVGDMVITSKLSSAFPEGLLIGEVIGVNSESGRSSVEYVVKPAVALSKIEEVLVIQK